VTHTFLFVGCGLHDPDIQLLLEDYAFKYENGVPHYFVLSRGHLKPSVQQAVEKSMNIRILSYDPSGGHAKLKDAIDELVVLVNQERQQLQSTADW
jgi:hypothetical protein